MNLVICCQLLKILILIFFFSRDVADVAGLTSYAFGTEELDRHMMIFKKEYPLTEDELSHYRNGLEWDPVKAKEFALQVRVFFL